jgi:hypothetical protein
MQAFRFNAATSMSGPGKRPHERANTPHLALQRPARALGKLFATKLDATRPAKGHLGPFSLRSRFVST